LKAKEEQEAKAYHLHHHKHPHKHQHDHSNDHHTADPTHLPHLHDLPPIKIVARDPLQDALEFNPIVNLYKQDSGDTLRMTAPDSMQETNLGKMQSKVSNPEASL
jgi:hypothetical protein